MGHQYLREKKEMNLNMCTHLRNSPIDLITVIESNQTDIQPEQGQQRHQGDDGEPATCTLSGRDVTG